VDNIGGTDPHPLATLHLANFNKAGEELDHNWWRGDAERRLVVHSKCVRERDDSKSSRSRKYARLEKTSSCVRDWNHMPKILAPTQTIAFFPRNRNLPLLYVCAASRIFQIL
jgi:hypothetical protein